MWPHQFLPAGFQLCVCTVMLQGEAHQHDCPKCLYSQCSSTLMVQCVMLVYHVFTDVECSKACWNGVTRGEDWQHKQGWQNLPAQQLTGLNGAHRVGDAPERQGCAPIPEHMLPIGQQLALPQHTPQRCPANMTVTIVMTIITTMIRTPKTTIILINDDYDDNLKNNNNNNNTTNNNSNHHNDSK